MNKVDEAVKQLILQFPNLYPNRFAALARIFQYWHWNDKGELFEPEREKSSRPATSENFLKSFKENHKKALRELNEIDPNSGIATLFSQRELTARLCLHRARIELENIDLISQSDYYFGGEGHLDEHRFISTWLLHVRKYGLEHWSIIPKVEDKVTPFMTEGRIPPTIEQIDPEWRRAIEKWLGSLTPALNSHWGAYENKEWVCRSEEMKEVWDIIIKSLKFYRSSQEYKRQVDISRQTIENIVTEETSGLH